ncbi:MAG: ANTAR domain-containing response regulator [Planctomycetota bacterium]
MTTRSLRIAVADDEADMRDYFARVLPVLGHEVVAVARNGRELVEQSLIARPDLLVVDVRMPVMDGLEAVREICAAIPTPAIVVSAYSDAELVRRAMEECVMAYLIKPIKQTDIEPAIAIAISRYGEMEQLRQETADLRRSLEDRKIIERAKGVLMKRMRLDEPEALRRLQKMASESNRRLVEVARGVIEPEGPSGPR